MIPKKKVQTIHRYMYSACNKFPSGDNKVYLILYEIYFQTGINL